MNDNDANIEKICKSVSLKLNLLKKMKCSMEAMLNDFDKEIFDDIDFHFNEQDDCKNVIDKLNLEIRALTADLEQPASAVVSDIISFRINEANVPEQYNSLYESIGEQRKLLNELAELNNIITCRAQKLRDEAKSSLEQVKVNKKLNNMYAGGSMTGLYLDYKEKF